MLIVQHQDSFSWLFLYQIGTCVVSSPIYILIWLRWWCSYYNVLCCIKTIYLFFIKYVRVLYQVILILIDGTLWDESTIMEMNMWVISSYDPHVVIQIMDTHWGGTLVIEVNVMWYITNHGKSIWIKLLSLL